jgi:hypothetical protein
VNINENRLRQIIREALASRLNEGSGYKLIDLIKDVCDEFNDQYEDKNLRSRPGKYNGRACIVVGGRGWDSVITGAFKSEPELQGKLDSIITQMKQKAKSEEEPLDRVVAGARCDGVIKVKIKEDGKLLDTPLEDSAPGSVDRIEDYALFAVLIADKVPKASR